MGSEPRPCEFTPRSLFGQALEALTRRTAEHQHAKLARMLGDGEDTFVPELEPVNPSFLVPRPFLRNFPLVLARACLGGPLLLFEGA